MMKLKIIFSILTAAAGISTGALAQGTVQWVGADFASFTGQTNSTQYSPLTGGGSTGGGAIGNTEGSIAAGTGYYGELLYTGFNGSQSPVPTTLAALAAWTDTGLSAVNGSVSGRFPAVNFNAAQVVPWAAGTTQSIIFVVWSQNLGATYAAALAAMESGVYSQPGYFGESATGYINPSTSIFAGATLFNNSPQGPAGVPIGNSVDTQLYLLTPGFSASITPVPEPAPLALAGLGGLWLVALRRRK